MDLSKLFIANIRASDGLKPLVTVRAAAEGEARLFLAAAYRYEEVVDVVGPSDRVSDADTGSSTGDIREHAGVEWQTQSSLAGWLLDELRGNPQNRGYPKQYP